MVLGQRPTTRERSRPVASDGNGDHVDDARIKVVALFSCDNVDDAVIFNQQGASAGFTLRLVEVGVDLVVSEERRFGRIPCLRTYQRAEFR